MSAFKGTPGPWAVNPVSAQVDAMPSLLPVCQLLWPTDQRSEAETEANARLIAAAPELLEACQTFAEWMRREEEGLPDGIERGTPEGERQWRIWWDENLRICDLAQQQALAAIAKATGEQS